MAGEASQIVPSVAEKGFIMLGCAVVFLTPQLVKEWEYESRVVFPHDTRDHIVGCSMCRLRGNGS